MSEAVKHTLGPWEVAYTDQNGQAVVMGPHTEICTCWHHCVESIRQEMEANAHLIAAAPDFSDVSRELQRLSLVIESAVRNADLPNRPDVLALINANRAAIAKAEGHS